MRGSGGARVSGFVLTLSPCGGSRYAAKTAPFRRLPAGTAAPAARVLPVFALDEGKRASYIPVFNLTKETLRHEKNVSAQ